MARLRANDGSAIFKGTVRDGCKTTARVFVEDTEIPYVGDGITITKRKTGPSNIVSKAEIEVPIEWGGESVAEVIDGLSGGGTPRQQTAVAIFSDLSKTYVPVHHGYVYRAGSGSTTGTAKIVVADYAKLFENIPVSKTFRYPDYNTILNYIYDVVKNNQSLIDNFRIAAIGDSFDISDVAKQVRKYDKLDDEIEIEPPSGTGVDTSPRKFYDYTNSGSVAPPTLGEDLLKSDAYIIGDNLEDIRFAFNPDLGIVWDGFIPKSGSKEFTPNRHSLVDVINWFAKSVGAYWYVETFNGHVTLVFDRNPTTKGFYGQGAVPPNSPETSDVLLYADAELTPRQPHPSIDYAYKAPIIENNALYELNPAHAITVVGHGTKSIYGQLTNPQSAREYPEATATDPLLAGAVTGSTEPKRVEVDANTTQEAENHARKILKNHLDESAGGDMLLAPTPRIEPFNQLRAKPVCGTLARQEMPTIPYEVEEVIHEVTTEEAPTTTVRCSLFTDPSRFEITSTMKSL